MLGAARKTKLDLRILLQGLTKSDAGLFQDCELPLQGLDPASHFVQQLKLRHLGVAERFRIKLNIINCETRHGRASHKKYPPTLGEGKRANLIGYCESLYPGP